MAAATYLAKADASIVREKKTALVEKEAQRLYEKHGTLTPKILLDSARAETSALHRFFEWDDGKAAEKYRIAQATQMILATKFVCVLQENRKGIVPKIVRADEHSARLVRKFLPADGRGEGFRERSEVLADGEMRAALVDRKKGQLRAWCSSVVDIEELAPAARQDFGDVGLARQARNGRAHPGTERHGIEWHAWQIADCLSGHGRHGEAG